MTTDSKVREPILLIEDDTRLSAMIEDYLEGFEYKVTAVTHGKEGMREFERESYGALVLDIMLPDSDGLDLCRQIRTSSNVPILMLTARGDPMDRIVGLELGADDYLPKPFEPRELLARLRAILRRADPSARSEILRFGRLEIDLAALEARLDGQVCELTSYQFELLVTLARSAGRVLSRDQLMDHLRGTDIDAFDRSIDVHISRIRAAIEDDPKRPRRIITVRGAGYVFARAQD